ncbi:MAG TPA: Crp/Fnr family transcriptional regulator [Terriglobales bacterium]|jgi:CRP-like cAMP-binding protein
MRNRLWAVRQEIEQLSKIQIVQGLSKVEQTSVFAAALYRRFPSTSVVTSQGEPANHLFLLLKGSARYFFLTPDGRKTYLMWLTPGDIFGGATLLVERSYFLVSTEIVKGSRALVWRRSAIRDLTIQYPRLLENSLNIAHNYLVWYVATHMSLICHSARERLGRTLIALATGLGKKCGDGLQLDVTNEQLANTANITEFSVSRFLNEWQRNGALTKCRGGILLRAPDRLLQHQYPR